MVYSIPATALFSVRNAGRTADGEIGRLPVTVGQVSNTMTEVAKYNNAFSRGIKSSIDTLNEVAKTDKVMSGVSKAVNFAKNHVNTLIVASSALNVGMAKDKKTALVGESGNVIGMFAIEGLMKKHLDKLVDKLPIKGYWKAIIKGVIFVAGSIMGSTAGKKLFLKLIGKTEEDYNKDPKLAAETDNKSEKPVDYKA